MLLIKIKINITSVDVVDKDSNFWMDTTKDSGAMHMHVTVI